jgi:hypothetical protein
VLVHKETLTIAPVAVSCGADPEFVDLHGLELRYGIRRSSAYNLIADGSIKSICLRRRGQIKGRRLIEVASVRNFLALQPTDVDPVMSQKARKAQKASAEAKPEEKERQEREKAGAGRKSG